MRKAADHIVTVDPAFAGIVEAAGLCVIGKKNRTNVDPFHALVSAVIAQQLSTKVADTITERFHALVDGNVSPDRVSALTDDEIRGAGLSGAKTRTIKGLAHAIHSGDVDFTNVEDKPDHHIVDELTALWGIGRWTVDMFLMFNLHRLDVWPVGDLAMRKGWQQIHHQEGDIDQKLIDPLGDPFKPYRSVVAWYCWRQIEGDNPSW